MFTNYNVTVNFTVKILLANVESSPFSSESHYNYDVIGN